MGDFGISDKAPENEKIKQEFNDFLYGFNSVGDIDYITYSKIYDKAVELFDRMYDLGKK